MTWLINKHTRVNLCSHPLEDCILSPWSFPLSPMPFLELSLGASFSLWHVILTVFVLSEQT